MNVVIAGFVRRMITYYGPFFYQNWGFLDEEKRNSRLVVVYFHSKPLKDISIVKRDEPYSYMWYARSGNFVLSRCYYIHSDSPDMLIRLAVGLRSAVDPEQADGSL